MINDGAALLAYSALKIPWGTFPASNIDLILNTLPLAGAKMDDERCKFGEGLIVVLSVSW